MPTSNALPKIIAGLLLLIAPASVGWRAGVGGRGKRFVRVCAGLALLAAVSGMSMILLATSHAAGDPTPPGNDFAFRGGFESVEGGVLIAAAVLLAIVACAGALAQTRSPLRRGWFTALLFTVAMPLVLSVTFFTLDLLRVESRGAFLLVSGVFGAVATLGAAAYAIFGVGWKRPREIARSS